MNNKKRSIIWQTERTGLVEIVNRAKTMTEILKSFGLINKGNNTITLRKRLVADHIDFSHIPVGLSASKGIARGGKKLDDSLVFCEGSKISRGSVKNRILRHNLLPKRCALCPIEQEWRGRFLSLILDHINGISNDNRIENLRLVCPNCASQLDTHAGKNKKLQGLLIGRQDDFESLNLGSNPSLVAKCYIKN